MKAKKTNKGDFAKDSSAGVAVLEDSESEHKGAEQVIRDAQEYAESIVATVREPLLVLDADLRVITANRSFCQTFQVAPDETENRLLYDLGDRQWDIPKLREFLEKILPKNTVFNDFEVEHDFPTIGQRIMILNARRIYREADKTQMILLAIEDITERKRMDEELRKHREHLEELVEERTAELKKVNEALQKEITERKRAEETVKVSETRYRRLFETALDGILILDAETGQITEVNPFLMDMLGYSHQELFGKKLWEIGVFKDIEECQRAFLELQTKGSIRYEDLPLETKDGRHIDVEFVSNVYTVDHQKVIQCNIRNITERRHLEQVKEEFVGMVSHELRTPMTSIREVISQTLDGILGETTPEQRSFYPWHFPTWTVYPV